MAGVFLEILKQHVQILAVAAVADGLSSLDELVGFATTAPAELEEQDGLKEKNIV